MGPLAGRDLEFCCGNAQGLPNERECVAGVSDGCFQGDWSLVRATARLFAIEGVVQNQRQLPGVNRQIAQ